MDFIHDTLADGTPVRVLSVVDVYTREGVALVPQFRLRGEEVAAWLSTVSAQRDKPVVIPADHGPEFVSLAMDHWA